MTVQYSYIRGSRRKKMTSRIKNIIKIGLFLFLCGVILCESAWLFRSNQYLGRANIVGIHNEDPLDVVFVGASGVQNFYIPARAWNERGIASYSYCAEGIRANLAKEYLMDIRRTHDPVLYVVDLSTYETTARELDEGGLRNWTDSMPPLSLIRIEGLYRYLKQHDIGDLDVPSLYFDLIRYHSNTDSLKLWYNWLYLNTKNVWGPSKGFIPLLGHIAFEPVVVSDGRTDIDRIDIGDLCDLLDYCDANKLNVLFTFNPTGREDHEIRNTMGDYIRSRGYDYLDLHRCCEDMGLDHETDYANSGHVNYLGAVKYTDYMIRYIIDHYNLPDHRLEDEYADWNEAYSIYDEEARTWEYQMEQLIKDDKNNKTIGENLSKITDLQDWLDAIDSGEFYLLICASDYNKDFETVDDISYRAMMNKWKIDQMDAGRYIGAWDGEKCIFSSTDVVEYSDTIGQFADEVVWSIDVSDTNSIHVREECVIEEQTHGISIVVYEVCYQQIVDVITIDVDASNKPFIER